MGTLYLTGISLKALRLSLAMLKLLLLVSSGLEERKMMETYMALVLLLMKKEINLKDTIFTGNKV